MLKLELKYWGINEKLFNPQAQDKFEILDELFNKSYVEVFQPTNDTETFFRHLDESKIDFRSLFQEGRFKFKNEFRIKSIREVAQIEYGHNYSQKSEIGRYWGMNHEDQDYWAYDGEMVLKDSRYIRDGFGRYIDK